MGKQLINSFMQIIERDLDKLELELKQYSTEALIWKVQGEIKNPAGNLCLHLCGNLQHYIGARLGNTGFKRNRDLEFSTKNVSRERLIGEIQKTKKSVSDTLEKLNDTALEKLFPEEVLGYPMTTGFFLIHLTGHLNYHLGQVNYHRRLMEAE